MAPHISAFVKIFFKAFGKCIDRGCTCDRKRTMKLTQEDYDLVYTGPEFLIEVRYSQIISSVFILMIYSSGIPALYIVGCLQFFLMYWVDKFLCKSSFFNLCSCKSLQNPSEIRDGTLRHSQEDHHLCNACPPLLRILYVLKLCHILLPGRLRISRLHQEISHQWSRRCHPN